ncbi:MAG TPA: metallopeptidase family protein [Patescibacteria group bacterium]|nr:metallopeptidase family protein [Patescibacteria group bacterium]
MIRVSDEQFMDMISSAMDELPHEHMRSVSNVAVVYADEPTPDQRQELKLRCTETLFGLYQGVPLTQRGGSTSYPPDKITIFKHPMEQHADSIAELKEQIKRTVWHEIAHYFGLNHDQIHSLEHKN